MLEMLGGDVVAVWEVALSDGVYRIEFAHGTTTGKRVVYVNGKVRPGLVLLLEITFTVESSGLRMNYNRGSHNPESVLLLNLTVCY